MLFSYFTSQMDLERNLFNLCFGVNVVVTKYFYNTCFKIGAVIKVLNMMIWNCWARTLVKGNNACSMLVCNWWWWFGKQSINDVSMLDGFHIWLEVVRLLGLCLWVLLIFGCFCEVVELNCVSVLGCYKC